MSLYGRGMGKLDTDSGVWCFYDGECPLCNNVAMAMKIKHRFGILRLINARDPANSELVREVSLRSLDLDKGMVIYTNGCFYHGKDALLFMARYGEAHNTTMVLTKTFFRSNFISSFSYPLMRGVRNLLLRVRGVGKINNLGNLNKQNDA